jgi:hypothetical protein
MSSHALLVMNPRNIEECVRSITALEVDKFWFTGFPEQYLEGPINDVIAQSGYDYYTIVSDDVVVTPRAFQAVTDATELPLDDAAVVSGWCNLDITDVGLRMSSVIRSPFATFESTRENYDWVPINELLAGSRLRRTWFAGMCMTCMSRALWQRFPFQYNGPSDFSLSVRLQIADVPIYAVRDAGVFHVKECTDPWRLDEEPRKALVHLQGQPRITARFESGGDKVNEGEGWQPLA